MVTERGLLPRWAVRARDLDIWAVRPQLEVGHQFRLHHAGGAVFNGGLSA